jgi:glutaredoxin
MKEIKLFGFEGCPYCQEMKELLDNENITYTYIDIDLIENAEIVENVIDNNGIDSVPVIWVGEVLLVPEKSFDTIQEGFELIKRFLNE